MAKKQDKKKETEETYTSADLKRYIGALMEENREQIKGISEQFVDFDRKLDLHTEILATHDQWFINIDLKLNSHTIMIGTIAEDVAVLKEDVSIIKDDLKQKVDRGEFVALERRVSVVEANV